MTKPELTSVKRPLLWEPAIYEHKAALIGRAPAEVAASADLLVEAMRAEHHAYHADFLTVGIDVYNVEAEALGAHVDVRSGTECPEILRPLWSLESLPAELELPAVPRSGRFALLLDVGERVRDELGAHGPGVRVAASGPVSIAAKLVGTENLLIAMITGDPSATRLLEFTTELALRWLAAIRAAGLDAIVFDSSASPPMVGPELFSSAVLPLHRRLMTRLAASGQPTRPLVLGGDTTSIVGMLFDSAANQIICDYGVDAASFARAVEAWRVRQHEAPGDVSIRRNAAPSAFASGSTAGAGAHDVAGRFVHDLRVLRSAVGGGSSGALVIAGTGILPYGQQAEGVRAFRRVVEAAIGDKW